MKPRLSTASLAILTGSAALAGSNPAPKPTAAPTTNPLSFADGILTVDLEARARFEARSNNRDFDRHTNDDNDNAWGLTRFRLGLLFKPRPWLKIYAQGKDTREIDSERPNTPGIRGNEGDDNLDLRQLSLELADYDAFPLGLTVGRQRLSYGEQRLVADSRWGNLGRTFDAFKLRAQPSKDQWLELFAARPVQIKQDVLNDSDSSDLFLGAYYSTNILSFQTTNLYLLHRDKTDNQPDLDPTNTINPRGTFNGPAQRITTIGSRWKSNLHNGWDYNAEAAWQTGSLWTTDRSTPALHHQAFAAHADVGYTWSSAWLSPRLGAGYNFASGDHNPADGKNTGFLNLFASNHGKYGELDLFSWRNIHNAQIRLGAQFTKTLSGELSYHADWLADTADYWTRSNGISAARTNTPDGRDVRSINAGNFAGQETDLVLKWAPKPHFTLDLGYAHFFAGTYLKATGPADDADFAYLQTSITF